ncbi:MAG: metallophosphoesterase [Candidatus Marinimicrobia bacterium]|nr:metallophosphoesterase [Candidatus Neomarinimicrobiota bacterium]MBT7200189.1 metallophosphoesterase [Candidatus Neomarinimicrobiota bacterium]
MINFKRILLTPILGIVLLILGSCVHTSPNSAVTPEQSAQFYFVHITDTHFGDANHYARTEKIIELVNDLPMDIKCVVHTGDITSDNITQDSIVTRGLAILSKLDVPIHYVAGNHDILENDLKATRRQYEEHFGPLISVREYEGVQFVTVFTEPIGRGYVLDGFDPLKELEEILSSNKPSIVFHHSPSPDDFYRNSMHDSWKVEGRDKWVDLLNRYNVKAVMAGHYHRDEVHWLGNVPLYVSAPVGSWWGRQASYRLFEYKNGKVGYRTQYILMDRWKNGQIPTLIWE